jgi:FkbM family methyltransferase
MPLIDLTLTSLRVRKLLFALRHPLSRRALKHGVAASVEHAEALAGGKYQLIVDVGANKGQFALFSRLRFPNAQILSFEPLPEPARRFGRLFAADPGVVLHQSALGEASGWSAIHVTADDDSSSLLEVGERQSEVFGTREVASQRVEVHRLDDFLSPQQIVRPALLKIDVQGYEANVLRGCGELLPLFDDVYVEASYVELYRDQAAASDVIDLLRGAGFFLRGVFNQFSDENGVPLQADFLFCRVAGDGSR